MRYLGNKDSFSKEIEDFFQQMGLLDEPAVLLDAFCGTGSVSKAVGKHFSKVIINDNLSWATTYTLGRLSNSSKRFRRLEFDPFERLNGSTEIREGFFYKNYSPASSERMYFTPTNAGRIDFFRQTIEEWNLAGLLDQQDYAALLASLIEALSKVSNTAGVYGAFLKKWDPRALKPIILEPVGQNECGIDSIESHNAKIENIIETIECDVLYLDPPYTQNQYGTQYHIFETLVLADDPPISKITGSRSTAPMRSDWSKEYKAHILLEDVLSKTKARHVVLSYSNKGLMSKKYIESVLKRHGRRETYQCKALPYKKYQNWKSDDSEKHYEYLFYIELLPKDEVVYECPLNYFGSKAQLIPAIKDKMPKSIDSVYDLFGGGFNVGANINASEIHYNDCNYFVESIIKAICNIDTYEFIKKAKKYESRFALTKGGKDAYHKARAFYNSKPPDQRDPILLFVLITYGFNQQIRFNGNHEFNNPPGIRWFNDNILEKLISFSRIVKNKNCLFSSLDYQEALNSAKPGDFVYCDPPYRLTTGTYNDGKRGFSGWSLSQEAELLSSLDLLDKHKINFMLSYVIEYKGERNREFSNWIEARPYRIFHIKDVLGISGSKREEVLVVNYEYEREASFHCKTRPE